MSDKTTRLKQLLELKAHPGPACSAGYFKESYVCEDTVAVNTKKLHSAASCVYFMLEKEGFTTWQMHVGHDEKLLHHEGECVKMHTLSTNGDYKCQLLGSPLSNIDARPQVVIPRDTWMAQELANKSDDSYALISAFVVPGFDVGDVKVANIEELMGKFPDLKETILKFAPLTTDKM